MTSPAGSPRYVRSVQLDECCASVSVIEIPSTVVVPPGRRDLLELDLTELTYG